MFGTFNLCKIDIERCCQKLQECLSLYSTHIASVIVLILAALSVFQITPGHNWGGDFSLYIVHAINMVEGHSYIETNYVPNPMYPYFSPQFYPPGLPAVLSIIYLIFGFNIFAMKAAIVLLYCISLIPVFIYFSRQSTTVTSLLITLGVALNPYSWYFKDQISSEYLFVLLVFTTLLIADYRYTLVSLYAKFILAICAAILAYMACATREVGIVLLPTIFVYDILRRKRLEPDLVVFVLAFAFLYLSQKFLFHLDMSSAYREGIGGYRALFYGWQNVIPNLWSYIIALAAFFQPHRANLIIPFMALPFLVFLLLGVFFEHLPKQFRSFPSFCSDLILSLKLHDFFLLSYAFAVLLQPFGAGGRYLIPLLPIFMFYIVGGGLFIFSLQRRFRKCALSLVLFFLISYHALYYIDVGKTPIPVSVYDKSSVELFDFVRTNLPKDSLIVFSKPRVLGLFGDRKSTIWPNVKLENVAWKNLRNIGATHIVFPRVGAGLTPPPFMGPKRDIPDLLAPVFANDFFTVYRLEW